MQAAEAEIHKYRFISWSSVLLIIFSTILLFDNSDKRDKPIVSENLARAISHTVYTLLN